MNNIENTWKLFHKLWTRDVGREGYCKDDWKNLETAIGHLVSNGNKNDLHCKVSTLSNGNFSPQPVNMEPFHEQAKTHVVKNATALETYEDIKKYLP